MTPTKQPARNATPMAGEVCVHCRHSIVENIRERFWYHADTGDIRCASPNDATVEMWQLDFIKAYKKRNNKRRDEDDPALREAVDDIYRLLGFIERRLPAPPALAAAQPPLICARCGSKRYDIDAANYLCRICFGTEVAAAQPEKGE